METIPALKSRAGGLANACSSPGLAVLPILGANLNDDLLILACNFGKRGFAKRRRSQPEVNGTRNVASIEIIVATHIYTSSDRTCVQPTWFH